MVSARTSAKYFLAMPAALYFIAKLLRVARVAESIGVHHADEGSVAQKADIAHDGIGFIIQIFATGHVGNRAKRTFMRAAVGA
jgi:hypothetical protein